MQRNIMAILTLLLSGRAMTLFFLSQAGGGNPGDPPSAWLMPLIGDAVIGVTAIAVLAIILTQKGLWAWVTIIVWNAIGIWDALAAFVIHATVPWPEFFMIELLGPSMFFGAAVMHTAIIILAWQPKVKEHFLG